MARHVERRGRRHAYEQLDPQRTALVVVDLLAELVETMPDARGIVDPVARLATATRRAGGLVAWVQPTVTAPSPWAVDFFDLFARTTCPPCRPTTVDARPGA